MAKQRFSPIPVPKEAKVLIKNDHVQVQGPLGKLEMTISPLVSIEQKEDKLLVTNRDNSKAAASQQGTTRSLIINMIKGVVKGINKQLVGDVAAVIRKTKTPDPYKHKGVRYGDEVIRKKVGKRAVVQG